MESRPLRRNRKHLIVAAKEFVTARGGAALRSYLLAPK
jgi:hypothetical protein